MIISCGPVQKAGLRRTYGISRCVFVIRRVREEGRDEEAKRGRRKAGFLFSVSRSLVHSSPSVEIGTGVWSFRSSFVSVDNDDYVRPFFPFLIGIVFAYIDHWNPYRSNRMHATGECIYKGMAAMLALSRARARTL